MRLRVNFVEPAGRVDQSGTPVTTLASTSHLPTCVTCVVVAWNVSQRCARDWKTPRESWFSRIFPYGRAGQECPNSRSGRTGKQKKYLIFPYFPREKKRAWSAELRIGDMNDFCSFFFCILFWMILFIHSNLLSHDLKTGNYGKMWKNRENEKGGKIREWGGDGTGMTEGRERAGGEFSPVPAHIFDVSTKACF